MGYVIFATWAAIVPALAWLHGFCCGSLVELRREHDHVGNLLRIASGADSWSEETDEALP